jgi:hypothetical protein
LKNYTNHLKTFSLLLLVLTCYAHATAQEKTIVTGRVLAAEKPLQGATVTFTLIKDSTQLSSHITTVDGSFTIPDLPLKDSLKMTISFVGFTPYEGLLVLQQKLFNISDITLQPISTQMDAVIVKVEKLATVKGDTVEFRASAIKTPPNSMAADVLKRIPGLVLDRNGKLTYNGRPVTKILVDGKPFFGEDGAVALANLPAEMIEKIQMANDSLRGSNEQTDLNHVLNLKLKRGAKYFANGYAAAGTDDRYDGSLFASRIKDKDRISLSFGRNNINKAGINSDNNIQLLTIGSGITRATFGGLDYGRTLTEGSGINASYGFGYPTTYRESLKERRQDILPSTSLITNSSQASRNQSANHRGDLRYNSHKETSDINVAAAFNYSSMDNLATNNATTADAQTGLLNALQSKYTTKGFNKTAAINIDGGKRFNKMERELDWGFNYSNNNTNTKDHNDALTLFYRNNAVDSQYHFMQEIENKSASDNASFRVRYRQPLGKHTFLSFSDGLSMNRGHSDKTTWTLDSSGKRLKIDSLYSNYFKNSFLNNSSDVSFEYRTKAWNVNAGFSLLQNYGDHKDLGRKTSLKQNTRSPALRSSVNHFTKKNAWSLNTSANYTLPTINQLQPVQDITNPLYIVIGNPGLHPQVNYNNSLNWRSRKLQVNGRPLALINSVDLSWNAVHDKIVTSVQYDSLGKQTVTYKNVNGIHNVRGAIQFSFQRKWGAHFFNMSVRPRMGYAKDRNFLNGVLYDNHRVGIQSSFNFSYRKSDVISLVLNYAPSWNCLHYDQNKTLDQSFAIHSVNIDLDLYLFKKIKMSNAVDYTYNNSLPASYDRSSLLWNAGASYICFKNKRGEISFTAFDILKRFNNLARSIGGNYIEDTQSLTLQRYFMTGFKYFFGKLKEQ